MADQVVQKHDDLEDLDNPNYQPPPEKSLQEILDADKEDESLRKYKEALLGQLSKDAVIVDANDPRKVIVKKLALMVDGHEDLVLDLSGETSFKHFIPGV